MTNQSSRDYMRQYHSADRSATKKWNELKAMGGKEIPGVPDSLTFHVEDVPTKTWVGPPNIQGVDRPFIRRQRGRWVIYYGHRKFYMYEDAELKYAILFATWMTEGFWK